MRLDFRLSKLVSYSFAIPVCAGIFLAGPVFAQQHDQSNKQTSEPVFRVSKLVNSAGNPINQESERSDLAEAAVQSTEQTSPAPVAQVAENVIAESPTAAPGNRALNAFPTRALPSNQPGIVRPESVNPNSVVPNTVVPNAVVPNIAANLATQPVPGTAIDPAAPSTARLPAELMNPGNAASTTLPHPLDQAIQTANDCLRHMQNNVVDYSAIMVKRERVEGVLGDQEYMQIKVRNPRMTETAQTPFSIYMKFLRPRKSAGREVIYVAGENDNKLIAHETGVMRFKRFYLEPTGWVAMKGNRHPITDAGLESLVYQLIEKAERDRAAGDCITNYRDDVAINDRPCNLIEVIHPDRRAPYEFHKARVFIDQELNVPVRYAAFDWPQTPGGQPPLLEEYTYINVSMNIGLQDIDFSPDNPNYEFPNR